MKNIKKDDETNLDYLYEMLSIATQGNVDIPAVITYTVDGLPGLSKEKHFLYEPETLKELK